jgi:hypothetical protein
MPYIKKEDRKKFEEALKLVKLKVPSTPGELNYLFSMISAMYLHKTGKKYQYLNDVGGAALFSVLELYRRVIGPYEDSAIKKNGDL